MMNRFRFVGVLALTASAFSAEASSANSGEFFVRWRSGTSEQHLQLLNKLGIETVWQSSVVPGLERVALANSRATAPQIAKILSVLSHDPQVIYAEPNFKVRRRLPDMKPASLASLFSLWSETLLPNDPMLGQQWAMNTEFGVHAFEAWGQTQGSKDIKVAVIDTGIDKTHQELSDRVLPGYDFISNTDQVVDGHGHGTHVAGIIGAASNNGVGIAGINPNVSFIPIRAVPNDDDETDANVIAAFEFAAKNGARVANCSFGKEASSQAVGDTIEAVGKEGLLAIVAAGNDGADNNHAGAFPANFRTSNMIVVASISSNGSLSYFSNYGLGMVDIAAPGSSILSSLPGDRYASWSGTSMATPHVVGVAALALSANPTMTVAQLKEVVLSSAVKQASLSSKVTTGGRVDALAAVNAARNLPGNP